MKKLQPHEKRFVRAIILVLVFFLIPIIGRQPPYEELEEAQIQIESVLYTSGRRGGHLALIIQPDGKTMVASGRLSSREDFENKLPGATAQVKYYRGVFPFPARRVEELTVNGETIITYRDRQTGYVIFFCTIGGIYLVIEFLFFAGGAHLWKKLRKKIEKKRKG